MPSGQSHEIVRLPKGFYRVKVTSAKAVFANKVKLFNLDDGKPIATVGNDTDTSDVEARFEIENETLIRFSHYFREGNKDVVKGSIKRVIERPDAQTMTFCCEDDTDDDYDDIRVVVFRFSGDDFATIVPIFS